MSEEVEKALREVCDRFPGWAPTMPMIGFARAVAASLLSRQAGELEEARRERDYWKAQAAEDEAAVIAATQRSLNHLVRAEAAERVLARCLSVAGKHCDTAGLSFAMHPAFEEANNLLSALSQSPRDGKEEGNG